MQICSAEHFIERLEKGSTRSLRVVSVELTRRCNLYCHHCYCRLPTGYDGLRHELALTDWLRILRQCADEGVLYLTFTGGEPLLYPDFRELWIAAKKMGFFVTLFSNGTLITDEVADFLAEWTPLEVSVTLYGASEEIYQKVTGTNGMFERTVSALDGLAKRHITLEVKGVFNTINRHEFEGVKAISQRYCEIFRWDAGLMGSFPGCPTMPQDVRLSVGECIALEQTDHARFSEMKEKFTDWEPQAPNGKGSFRCGVGRGSAHIDAFGGMHPCLPLESFAYDLRSGSVAEGWQSAIPKMLSEVVWPDGPCGTCDAAELCSCCAAFALLEDCSPTGPVPYRCKLAKVRARLYGVEERLRDLPEGFQDMK